MGKKRIAVVGATGLVGTTFLKVLEEYGFTDCEYTLMASARSAGKEVMFMGKTHTVEELTAASFDSGYDIALFSAGGAVSGEFAPIAAAKGCTVIDNSARWRMDKNVPLVVPEVNPQDAFENSGIIANPNCSTIQAVVALAPIHKKYGIKRIVYSTYQAVSGGGMRGCIDLQKGVKSHMDGKDYEPEKFSRKIFNNCIPQIDVLVDNGYYKEEQKMIDETRKILHDDSIAITATCVRVPVFYSHSETINVQLKSAYDVDELRRLLAGSPGIKIMDDPANDVFPVCEDATGNDSVWVGRIRRDDSVENGLNLWVVADNVRKGAAANAVQIASLLINK